MATLSLSINVQGYFARVRKVFGSLQAAVQAGSEGKDINKAVALDIIDEYRVKDWFTEGKDYAIALQLGRLMETFKTVQEQTGKRKNISMDITL
jgi:hypothetical protein